MQGFDNQIIGDQVQGFLRIAIRVVTLFCTKLASQGSTRDQGGNLDTGLCDGFNRTGDGSTGF